MNNYFFGVREMIETKRELFERFGRLDTWIVGIQYHDGAKGLDSPEVYFDRDPDNPFDPNAVAVFTRGGRQIGHLPRYDAEYFSPLIAEGVTATRTASPARRRKSRRRFSKRLPRPLVHSWEPKRKAAALALTFGQESSPGTPSTVARRSRACASTWPIPRLSTTSQGRPTSPSGRTRRTDTAVTLGLHTGSATD